MTLYGILSISLIASLLSFTAFGQKVKKINKQKPLTCPSYYDKDLKAEVYTRVEIEAEYPGGSAAWQRFLNKNLRFPQDEIDNGIYQSSTVATFIVKADGTLCNFGIKGHTDTTQFSSFDKMFLHIIKQSGKWTPAMCNGTNVASTKMQPIIICLREEPSPF